MFCTPELVSGGSGGVTSHFIVLHARTHFWRYRRCRIPFTCFALPNSFSAVPWASGPVIMFCAPALIFGGAECVGSHFHVLRARTCFLRYRGRRALFSFFACPDSILAVQRAPDPVLMFCAPGLIFGCAKCVGFRFHVLCSRTRFRRY
jgi:hypothetical protein